MSSTSAPVVLSGLLLGLLLPLETTVAIISEMFQSAPANYGGRIWRGYSVSVV